MIAAIKLTFFTGIGILAFASLAEALHINLWIGIAAFILAALASAHQQQTQQRRLQEEVERTTAELQQAQQRHRAAQQVFREAEQDLRDATNHRKTVQYLLNAPTPDQANRN